LRDLQKSGRIGRIEVDNEAKEGISEGIIKIPSSLTRKETALLAATIETVTRVGPCEAEVKLLEIRDVRETKRKKIIERAAELLKAWDQNSLESSEIKEQIDTDIKLGEIISWGPENLPAGPDIDSSQELIIVEGRADVLNLLRIGVKNTVAVQGTQIPKSIIDLTQNRESVTAFLDGDRGGTIILNELTQLAKIDYVARAPEGYEVEELTRKQLIKSLQNKKSATNAQESEPVTKKETPPKETLLEKLLKKVKAKNQESFKMSISSIEPGHSIGFSKNMEKLFDISVGEVFEKIHDYKDTQFLIIDGILSKRLLPVLLKMKIKFLACKNKEQDLHIPDQIIVFYY
jgi:DNA primase